MKIVHIIRSLDPAWGGPTAVASRLAAAQAALGQDVSLVAPSSPGRELDIQTSLKTIPNIDKVKIAFLSPEARICLPHKVEQELTPWTAQAHVIHIHGVWGSVLKTAAAMASRQSVPYVVAPHGMVYPWSLRQKRLKKQLGMILGYRRMLDRAAWLHALNADESQAISLLKLRPPIVELANGVFLDEVRPLPPGGSFYASYPMLGGKPFILFLSRLHPGKGLKLLADAFATVAKEHSDAHLVVAGPDYGARADLERQIRQAKLGERVHLVGPIYGAAKVAAMVDAACFCLPSEHETFSMAITEAMACGLPVVISRSCHYSEVAEAGAGYVVDLGPREIADALLRLLTTPTLRKQMGDAGRSLVESRFTWPTIAQQSLLAYQRAMRTPAAS